MFQLKTSEELAALEKVPGGVSTAICCGGPKDGELVIQLGKRHTIYEWVSGAERYRHTYELRLEDGVVPMYVHTKCVRLTTEGRAV